MTDQARIDKERARCRAKDKRRYWANPKQERAKNRAYHAAKRDKILARQRARYAEKRASDLARKTTQRRANPDIGRRYSRAYYAADPERCRANAKASRARHPETLRSWIEKNKERLIKQAAEWTRKNRARTRAATARRRTRKISATPPWVDHAAIQRVYDEANRLTQETGIGHDVDHIVPLHSPLVCGLHVAHNLQILTSTENRKKHNKLIAA